MMIKKVENVFGVGGNVEISKDFGVFLRLKPLFFPPVPTNTTKGAEQVFLGVLQHPTKLANISTGKFYLWRKSKNSLRVRTIFWVYFWTELIPLG